MAKVSTSKFGKVLSDLRKSNQQLSTQLSASGSELSDLKKSVNDLEYLSLLILEKIKRVEKYPVVQTKRGKLIPPKVGPTAELLPANDPLSGGDLDKDSSRSILLKLYNFMVRDSEEEKKNKTVEKNRLKERKKERAVNYRKEMIKAGIDPKLFKKKRGILGTIGTGLKWGMFGAIGLGLSGLVWLFSDEIKKFGETLKTQFADFSQFLTEKFQFVISAYEDLKKLFAPVTEWIQKTSKSVMEYFGFGMGEKGLFETLKENILKTVSSLIDTVVDKIIDWTVGIGNSIKDWLTHPLSWENYAKVMGGIAARFIAGPFAAKAVGAMGLGESGADVLEEAKYFTSKKQYGEDALSKIREIIDLNPKYASLDEESKKSLVNNIIQELETGQPPQDFLGAEKVSLKEIMGKRSEFDFKSGERINKQKELLQQWKSFSTDYIKKIFDQHGWKYVEQRIGDGPPVSLYQNKDTGEMITASPQDIRDMLLKWGIRDVSFDWAKEKVEQGANAFKPELDAIESQKKELMDKLEENQKQFRSEFGKLSEKSENVKTAVKQQYAGAQTPTDYASATKSILDKSINAGISAAGPTLSKVTSEDYTKKIGDYYDEMQKNFDKFGQEMSSGKLTALMEKFMPVKGREIGEDPNSESSILQRMQSDFSSRNISNNVVNGNTGNIDEIISTSIPVRNVYESYWKSNRSSWLSATP